MDETKESALLSLKTALLAPTIDPVKAAAIKALYKEIKNSYQITHDQLVKVNNLVNF